MYCPLVSYGYTIIRAIMDLNQLMQLVQRLRDMQSPMPMPMMDMGVPAESSQGLGPRRSAPSAPALQFNKQFWSNKGNDWHPNGTKLK